MNLNENDGAAGAVKVFSQVAIGKAFRINDTKYAKVDAAQAVRLDTAHRETIEADQGVYEYGAYSFDATYPTWNSIGANEVARLDGTNVLKLTSGEGLRLSDFAILTPGSGDPIAVASSVDGSFDP